MGLQSKYGKPASTAASAVNSDVAIRFGLVGLLAYWSWGVIAPFLTIMLWSAILTVALYPLFDRLARWLGHRWLAAVLITLLCLLIILAPVTWLGFGLISGVEFLTKELATGLPSPPESVKDWPIVGEHIFQAWSRAVTGIKAQLVELAPLLKPVGTKLLQIASNVMVGLLQFLASIVIAGFLFCPGPQLVDGLTRFMERVFPPRGSEMVQLAGATVRNVSRGIIGISLLQSFLAGAGFLIAGIPAAGLLAFVSLVLAVVQIGPAVVFLPIIIWSWTSMSTVNALMFTAYMIPVGLLDNLLKPVLMARGLDTPMPVIVIGVIGGTIAYGIIGLFFGPIVLSVAWKLITAWLYGGDGKSEKQARSHAQVATPQKAD